MVGMSKERLVAVVAMDSEGSLVKAICSKPGALEYVLQCTSIHLEPSLTFIELEPLAVATGSLAPNGLMCYSFLQSKGIEVWPIQCSTLPSAQCTPTA